MIKATIIQDDVFKHPHVALEDDDSLDTSLLVLWTPQECMRLGSRLIELAPKLKNQIEKKHGKD